MGSPVPGHQQNLRDAVCGWIVAARSGGASDFGAGPSSSPRAVVDHEGQLHVHVVLADAPVAHLRRAVTSHTKEAPGQRRSAGQHAVLLLVSPPGGWSERDAS